MELKPCPFCGGKATITINSSGDYGVECDNHLSCFVRPKTTNRFTSELDAKIAWNRRVGDES